ncbi:hypothetical protein QKW60_05120 [Defluviimonas aestuarii]|uniref:hypothetical protein n=1 Tax=Albidovulum aestuarii TaxID=1130726 RepID=UPI00249C4F86|nr:hypothetical protein [Defluviimonas aestuarii]MDI3335775.1 hypothetical protein [Defluviimonas aestuarii]
MDMPKQMDASGHAPRQQQQGEADRAEKRRTTASELAETPAEQMRAMHFSDWASI